VLGRRCPSSIARKPQLTCLQFHQIHEDTRRRVATAALQAALSSDMVAQARHELHDLRAAMFTSVLNGEGMEPQEGPAPPPFSEAATDREPPPAFSSTPPPAFSPSPDVSPSSLPLDAARLPPPRTPAVLTSAPEATLASSGCYAVATPP
jgi:hypothetical protein